MTDTTSTAVATRDNGPGALIEKYRGDFALVLPAHLKADHWVRVSQGVLRRDENLRRVATKNPGSFLAALLDCARLGLEPGDTYHLVPFGNEIQGIADWTGLVELVYRAGAVSSVKAEVVKANDTFRYVPGEMDRPVHEPDWFGDRGETIGAYAYAVMKDGAVSQVVIYSKAQIEEVRAVSKSSRSNSSPWVKWYDRMALKTVVRRLSKLVPSSAEYREQVLRTEAAVGDVAERVHVTLPSREDDPDPDTDGMPPLPEPVTDPDDDEIVDAEIVHDDDPDEPTAITDHQRKAIGDLFRARSIIGPARFDAIEDEIGRRVSSYDQLTSAEAVRVLAAYSEGDAA